MHNARELKLHCSRYSTSMNSSSDVISLLTQFGCSVLFLAYTRSCMRLAKKVKTQIEHKSMQLFAHPLKILHVVSKMHILTKMADLAVSKSRQHPPEKSRRPTTRLTPLHTHVGVAEAVTLLPMSHVKQFMNVPQRCFVLKFPR